jgi:hypothetical protein
VIKLRRRQIERAVEEQLAESREKQVRAAHHFGDAHGGVIHHDRELIGGRVVFAPDEEVAESATRDRLLRTGALIGELQPLALRDTETPVQARGRRLVRLR